MNLRPTVAALGGGHGLAASLSALRLMTDKITAIVTVADDGGSSGRLRSELQVLPPGDLRMALAALCDDSEWGTTWRDVMQHRFSTDGALDQHAMGNLLIVTLWELLGDSVAGLDWVGRLLGARGRVLPMSTIPLSIEADMTQNGEHFTVAGQSLVASTHGQVEHLRLIPTDPPACPEAVAAVYAADWVILGPGSWFSSVMPHLLVPELSRALHTTTAKLCVTMNLSGGDTETTGMAAADHLAALRHHAPELRVAAVLADPSAVEDTDALVAEAALLGATVLFRQVRRGDGSATHDPLRLAAAYQDVFDNFLGDVGTLSS